MKIKTYYPGFTLCAILLSIISCEKESILEKVPGKDSLAAYTITATDADCSSLITNGKFRAGVPTTENENTQIEVLVTREGKYSYSTDTLNGYYFFSEGKFDSLGTSTITLKAYGTPVTAGNSRFSFPRGLSEMHQIISVTDSGVILETVPATIYMKGSFGGQEFDFTDPTTVNNVVSGFGSGGDSVSFSGYVTPGFFPPPAGTGSFSFQKQHMHNFESSSEADFKDFFKPGGYPISFSKCEGLPSSNGFLLSWYDENNISWDLRSDSDQSQSYFNIVGNEDGHRADGRYFVKIKARFRVKLYSYPDNQMKEFTDGELSGYFVKPQ